MIHATNTEKSQVAYLEVMDAVSDRKDTQLELLQDLFTKFIKGQHREYLVVEGDQKLYEVLQSLKFEYGKELDWIIPFPGDWHLLKTYQLAVMKPYFDAGLKQLANASGYPTASIECCGQFKRTHHFLLEVWESLYRAMISMFNSKNESTDLLKVIFDKIVANKTNFDTHTLEEIIVEIQSIQMFEKFKQFIQQLARTDKTWRFWIQFMFQDMPAYIGLFLAIRGGDWSLRMACIKQMAPVFSAFDHFNYRKLISRHLADVLTMPQSVLTMLQQGGFVVSITGKAWHSVGIDESHEMLINKSCKMSIVRPSPDYINRIAHYLPYRTKALENLSGFLFAEEKKQDYSKTSPLSNKPSDIKREQNISRQITAISNSGMLECVQVDRGLVNPFTQRNANTQQTSDLLTFREIGQQEFINHVAFCILKQPSTTTLRKRRLQTFAVKKTSKRHVSKLQKDRNLILLCMKKKFKWSLRTGTPIQNAGEQLIGLPLAISDHDGNPRKGQKSNMTKALANRYKECPEPFILHDYPKDWQTECCIMEGMFMINTSPIGSQSTYSDYAKFLMQRHIIAHFHKGCIEVHLLFDNPGQLKNSPKYFEQKRRDELAIIDTGHTCENITESRRLPKKWRENVLNCRKCKRALVCFLTQFFLNHIHIHLLPSQRFYTAGAFVEPLTNTSWFVEGSQDPQPDPEYTCNAEETDTMLWLHASKTNCKTILILSPDTDVYMIGLPLNCMQDKNIIVQISTFNSREVKVLYMNRMRSALSSDPDLANITRISLSMILQTLFVVTGLSNSKCTSMQPLWK